jgi:hypothetical protein
LFAVARVSVSSSRCGNYGVYFVRICRQIGAEAGRRGRSNRGVLQWLVLEWLVVGISIISRAHERGPANDWAMGDGVVELAGGLWSLAEQGKLFRLCLGAADGCCFLRRTLDLT